jgi:hypothetical protein
MHVRGRGQLALRIASALTLLALTASGVFLLVHSLYVGDSGEQRGEDTTESVTDEALESFPGQRHWYSPDHPPRSVGIDVAVSGRPPDLQVTVTYELQLKNGDPILDQVRNGNVADQPAIFTDELMGGLTIYWSRTADSTADPGTSVDPEYSPPALRTEPGGGYSVTMRGEGTHGREDYGENNEDRQYPDVYGILIKRPQAPFGPSTSLASPLSGAAVQVTTSGWRIAAIAGPVPAQQDSHTARFRDAPFTKNVKLALVPESGPVTSTVADILANPAEATDGVEGQGTERLDASTVFWPLSISAPLLVLLHAVPGGHRRRRRIRWAICGVIGYMLLTGAVSLAAGADALTWCAFLAAVTVVPAAIGFHVLESAADHVGRAERWAILGTPAAIAGLLFTATCWSLSRSLSEARIGWTGFITGTALLAIAPFAAAFAHRHGWTGRRAVTLPSASLVGILSVSPFLLYAYVAASVGVYATEEALIVIVWPLAFGAAWGLVPAALVGITTRGRKPVWVISILVSGLLLWSVPAQYADSDGLGDMFLYLTYVDEPAVLAMLGAQALIALLAVVAAGALRGFGLAGASLKEPTARAIAIVLAMTTVSGVEGSLLGFLAVLAAGAAVVWLLPADAARRGGNFAAMPPSVHARVMRAELLRRARNAREATYFRAALRSNAEGDDEEDTGRDRPPGPPRTGTEFARRAAFGSGGGHAPWTNAKATLGAGLLLGLPLIVWESIAYRDAIDRLTLLHFIALLPYLGRWGVYGLLFGLFYTRIPGHTPLRKSLRLACAFLPAEVLGALDINDVTPRRLALEVALRVCQLLVFCVVLGFVWERRLLEAARLPWSAVRDFRRMRSLAAPLGTVVIAAVTAAATAFAGALSTPDPPSVPPPATSPPSAPPKPG